MRAVVFTGAGGPEVMRLEERVDPEPGSADVLVAVTYAGINPADIAKRAGRYPPRPGAPPDIPGLEVAGTVIATGSDVLRWKVGDRVFGLVGGGGLADRVVVHESHVVAVPGSLSDEQAAAVPEAFVTAHDAMVSQAQLGLGDVLLVNGANGGVGTAAVQIGVAAGATVFASVRDTDLRERVAGLGGTPVSPMDALESVAAAGGADVVLELVGAGNINSDIEALATRGRIAVVGPGSDPQVSLSLLSLMAKRGHIFATSLSIRGLAEKAAAIEAFAHGVVPLLASGGMKPVIDRVFQFQDAAEAFDHLAAPGKFGRVLLRFS